MQVAEDDKARRGGLPLRWALCAALGTALVALLGAHAERRLPPPRRGPPHEFDAFRAHRHLANLTAIGPRVAGSYENEVVAVKWVVETLRQLAAEASPHNRLEIDVHTSSGAFPLTFMDGMNNVYRDVQSVVARASGVGGRRARTALLLNCHFDTVPDSPGASDDAAGCAVLLETLRALLAAARPLRHDVVCLLNGAEENILQASHGFVAGHRWARHVRAFVNLEACGAGGREVLFQAGPHDPWLLEVYAAAAPHPFASSLAQELFQSGLIPADTDFRIFRDFGGLSGVDLAWNSNGYVYHTHLDTADRVPLGALQRTGDNVLALVRGTYAPRGGAVRPAPAPPTAPLPAQGCWRARSWRRPRSARPARPSTSTCWGWRRWRCGPAPRCWRPARRWRSPRCGCTSAPRRRARGCTCGAASGRSWWAPRRARRRGAGGGAGRGRGAGRARALRRRAAGLLLAALAAGAAVRRGRAGRRLGGRGRRVGAARRARGGGARLVGGARARRRVGGGGCALALAACAWRGLRSGFVPLGWGALAALADVAASLGRASPPRRALLWALGAALPAAHTAYLALASLAMLVPIMGRIGTPPVPADVIMASLVALLTLATFGWMTPLVAAAQRPGRLAGPPAVLALATAALLLAGAAGPPYARDTPQRVLLFHTRRTDHTANGSRPDHFFWIPEIDGNTPRSLEGATPTPPEECARWLYCGAPYYLPVRSLVARGHRLAAAAAPLPRLHARLALRRLDATTQALSLRLRGPRHLVLVLAPAEGAVVSWSSLLERPLAGPRWRGRLTYFFALHRARSDPDWELELHIRHNLTREPASWVELSLAGHSLAGARALHPEHRRLLRALPPWTAPTGWGVDLHLYRL
ncbi:unnamed protein product, partial [Iphiclides podalirius]